MASETIKIGQGFRLDSVTLYPNYAQVNGHFVYAQVNGQFVRAEGEAAVPGVNNSFTFNTTVAEGKSLVPGNTYDFGLTPQSQPDTPAPEPVATSN